MDIQLTITCWNIRSCRPEEPFCTGGLLNTSLFYSKWHFPSTKYASNLASEYYDMAPGKSTDDAKIQNSILLTPSQTWGGGGESGTHLLLEK